MHGFRFAEAVDGLERSCETSQDPNAIVDAADFCNAEASSAHMSSSRITRNTIIGYFCRSAQAIAAVLNSPLSFSEDQKSRLQHIHMCMECRASEQEGYLADDVQLRNSWRRLLGGDEDNPFLLPE